MNARKIEIDFVGMVSLIAALVGFIVGAAIAWPLIRAQVDDECRDAKAQARFLKASGK